MKIKLIIEVDEDFSFFLHGFPECPRKGDVIRLHSFITDEIKRDIFTEEQLNIIHTGSFIVDFVAWEKSDIGVYPLVFLEVE